MEKENLTSAKSGSLLERKIARRDFMATSLIAAGGLIVTFHLPPMIRRGMAAEAAAGPDYVPNAFIQVAPDNSITIVINKLEMGQGVNTSLAQLIAEELECDWKSIRTVPCPVGAVYNAVGMPFQLTGGSASMRTSWEQHRKIGAGMREMLQTAAAKRWGIEIGDTHAENGVVINRKGKEKLSYGELAHEAGKLPVPLNPKLKSAKDFKVIGKSPQRIDAADKVNGKAVYGIDVRLPGMLYASVTRPTFEKAELVSHDPKAARAVKGVVDVVMFGNKVAVLATNTYAAKKGLAEVNPKWDYGVNRDLSSAKLMARIKAENQAGKGAVAETRGAPGAEMANSKNQLHLEYEFPYLAHAPMEPMNCTIQFDGKTCEFWAGLQMPGIDRGAAAKTLGISEDKVQAHTVFAGGSFGRRACKNSDYVVEACQLVKKVKKPLKITWSREDDMRGGYYRPMYYHKIQIGLDEHNQVHAWQHEIAGQSIMANSPMAGFMKNGIDPTVTEGVTQSAYPFPNFECRQTLTEAPITTLWWRSVGNTHTAYVMETAVDELAEMAGQNVFDYRRRLLKKSPRHLAILDLLEKKTNDLWKKPLPGRALGLAIHESFESVVGHVVEISLDKGNLRTHRVWSVAHVGQVIHPEIAKTQLEGGIIFGLSALGQQVSLKDGQIVETNFDTYPVLRMQDAPVMDVSFVESSDPPTGLGEPGVPPVGPAVANALYQLTKKRLRILPFVASTLGSA